MIARLALGLFFVLAFVGCGGTRGVRGRLADHARVELACDDEVQVIQLTEIAFQASGCGRMREYTNVATGGRPEWETVVPAAALAARDLDCPLEQLSLADRRPSVAQRSFVGCGRSASYSLVCNVGGCTWVGAPISVALAP